MDQKAPISRLPPVNVSSLNICISSSATLKLAVFFSFTLQVFFILKNKVSRKNRFRAEYCKILLKMYLDTYTYTFRKKVSRFKIQDTFTNVSRYKIQDTFEYLYYSLKRSNPSWS